MVLVLLAGPARADDWYDSPMYADPAVPLPRVVKVFPPGSLELWLAALDRPEADPQAQAAVTIASAHERGMPGLGVAVGPLLRTLDEPNQTAAVRLAAARALVALDAREAAPSLLAHARNNEADLRAVVEPALARWKHPPAADYWLGRLAEPPPHGRGTVLAVQGLAALADQRAVGPLRELVRSPAAGAVRLAAARALGLIQPVGLSVEAEQLWTADRTDRLCAVALLRWHSGDVTALVLSRFAADPEPAVAGPAAERLLELHPNHAAVIADQLLASRGAEVRMTGVTALIKVPSVPHVRTLADTLADPHPLVRETARRGLRQLADKPDLRPAVIEQGTRLLAGKDWRGQEQAAVLLAQLGHKPAADRLVTLLTSDRGEVTAAAAWGLRVLALPDKLSAVADHLATEARRLLALNPTRRVKGDAAVHQDRKLCQLVQYLARGGHRPSESTFRDILPRGVRPYFSPFGPDTRGAAIWGLGRFYAGNPDADLAGLIEERLTGDGGLGLDAEAVRRMSAVALGVMKVEASVAVLRDYSGLDKPTADPVAHACRWAVAAVTGEKPPPPEPVEVVQRDPFLAPGK